MRISGRRLGVARMWRMCQSIRRVEFTVRAQRMLMSARSLISKPLSENIISVGSWYRGTG